MISRPVWIDSGVMHPLTETILWQISFDFRIDRSERTLLSEGKSSVICEATIAYRVNQNSQVAMVHFRLHKSSTSYWKVMRYSKTNNAGANS